MHIGSPSPSVRQENFSSELELPSRQKVGDVKSISFFSSSERKGSSSSPSSSSCKREGGATMVTEATVAIVLEW